MAAFFDNNTRSRRTVTEEVICDLLENGNISEIEDLDDVDTEFDPDVLFRQTAAEDGEDEGQSDENFDESPYMVSFSDFPIIRPPSPPLESPAPLTPKATVRESRSSRQQVSTSVSSDRSRLPESNQGRGSTRGRGSAREKESRQGRSIHRNTRQRIWRQTTFTEKSHNYPTLPTNAVRRPIEYFNDYFDTEFLEKMSHCTNVYYLRTTGRELKSTSAEIAKVLAIHIIMGCIPYPRLPMYWRAGTKLGLICDLMTRDRFLNVRNALHVVEFDSPPANDNANPLWKVQPMIDNAWRLYRNDCMANKVPRKDSMPLLGFRMNVADSLSCQPDRPRREDSEDDVSQVPRRDYKIYRPAIAPSEAKRYDGYEHYPISDDIKAPRSCRMKGCGSRSKIKCEKCDVYLCLSRDKNCFKSYHDAK